MQALRAVAELATVALPGARATVGVTVRQRSRKGLIIGAGRKKKNCHLGRSCEAALLFEAFHKLAYLLILFGLAAVTARFGRALGLFVSLASRGIGTLLLTAALLVLALFLILGALLSLALGSFLAAELFFRFPDLLTRLTRVSARGL